MEPQNQAPETPRGQALFPAILVAFTIFIAVGLVFVVLWQNASVLPQIAQMSATPTPVPPQTGNLL